MMLASMIPPTHKEFFASFQQFFSFLFFSSFAFTFLFSSSETPIRLARANMAASRLSPNSNYLPNDVTLAELFKYEQSLARETAKNTRTYSSISTSAES